MQDPRAKMSRLFREIREGSEEAAQEFVREYGDKIRRIIRRRLPARLRTVFDSLDFTQDVYLSLFSGKLSAAMFADPKALLNYLAAMARNKVSEATRQRLVAQRHNLNRERSLDGSACFEVQNRLGPEPTPSENVMAEETMEVMRRRMKAGHQRILELRREGYTHEEIAERLHLSPGHVRKLISYLDRRGSQS